MRVINFGSLNVDYVYKVDHFLQPGETCAALKREVCSGGKGLNQSVALAKAGVSVYHAGYAGSDGRFLVELMKEKGVMTDYIRNSEESNGHAIIQVDKNGQNCILLYPGTNHLLTEAYIDEILAFADKDDVILVQNETNLVGEIVRRAAEKGLRVAMNAAPMGEEVRSYPLEKLAWLFVNEIEGGMLSNETDPDKILRKLKENYPKTEIVLTLGGDGAAVAGPDGIYRCSAFHVKPIDTTAAGDTFTGFYLEGRLKGKGITASAKWASAASAIAIQRPGAADSIPSASEVKKETELLC